LAKITYRTPQEASPVSRLDEMTVVLDKGERHDFYTTFSVSAQIPGELSHESMYSILLGNHIQGYRRVDEVWNACSELSGRATSVSIMPEIHSSSDLLEASCGVVDGKVDGNRDRE
jgi:hypothetical protein